MKFESHEVQLKGSASCKTVQSACTLSASNFSQTRWCFAGLPTAQPHHCWWIPMVRSSCKVKRRPETLHSLYSAPQGHNPLKSNLLVLLSPLLLPDRIHFLPVMLLLLAYLSWFFCTCATIKWSIYRVSHLSHYGKSFFLLLGFFHIYYI